MYPGHPSSAAAHAESGRQRTNQVKGNNSPSLPVLGGECKKTGRRRRRRRRRRGAYDKLIRPAAAASPWVVCAKFGLNLTQTRKRANEKLESGKPKEQNPFRRNEPSEYFLRPAQTNNALGASLSGKSFPFGQFGKPLEIAEKFLPPREMKRDQLGDCWSFVKSIPNECTMCAHNCARVCRSPRLR